MIWITLKFCWHIVDDEPALMLQVWFLSVFESYSYFLLLVFIVLWPEHTFPFIMYKYELRFTHKFVAFGLVSVSITLYYYCILPLFLQFPLNLLIFLVKILVLFLHSSRIQQSLLIKMLPLLSQNFHNKMKVMAFLTRRRPLLFPVEAMCQNKSPNTHTHS